MALFVFRFSPVCNFGKFFSFGLGTVRSEVINFQNETPFSEFSFMVARLPNPTRIGNSYSALLDRSID